MFNNNFCEIYIKKVTNWGWVRGKRGTILISSWKCNYQYLLDIQVYYLDIHAIFTLVCIIFNDNWLLMCNYIFFYNIHVHLLKSDVSSHFKAYSSHSFQLTGIGLGSLWRGNRFAYWIHSPNPPIFFLDLLQLIILQQKNLRISKHYITFIICYNLKKNELGILIYLLNAMITSSFWYF